jgi:hypothetical protein
MSKSERRKLSVYLAEANSNASRGTARFFMDKSHLLAVILLQKEATTYSAVGGTMCPREVGPWGALRLLLLLK